MGHIAQHRAAFLGFSEQCDNDLQVVIANRDMGSTAVLRVTAMETQARHPMVKLTASLPGVSLSQAMALEEKRQWCAEHGKRLHDEDGIRNPFFSFQQVGADLRICSETWHK